MLEALQECSGEMVIKKDRTAREFLRQIKERSSSSVAVLFKSQTFQSQGMTEKHY